MENQIEQLSNYFFVEYTPFLIDSFYELYVSVHENKLSKEYFIKKISTSFTGHNVIGYLAFEKSSNKAVAFYGVYPVLVNYQNKIILAAQSADTLTHFEHRRKGLFEKLFELTKDKCLTLKVYFLFGFPNSKSAPGFEKFGWQFLPSKTTFFLHRKRNLMFKIQNKLLPNYYKWYLKKREISLTKFNSLSSVIRDFEYISYKSKLSNINFYKLKTCVIWAKTEINTLKIGDVIINENENIENIVLEITSLLKKLNLINLYFSVCHSHILVNEFSKLKGINVNKSPFIMLDLNNDLGLESFSYTTVDEDTF